MCCLLISFSFTGNQIIISPEWWPNSGVLYLKFDFWGMAPAFWTTASGLIFYLLNLKERPSRTYVHDGLFLFVLTSANLAFLAGNFLLRYAALEFAALGIAVIQLLEMGKQNSKRLYLGLRLGDAGLLVAIILLNTTGAPLEISKALSLAMSLPEVTLTWIAAGFLLAVWVKMGIWPLVFWQNAAADNPSLMNKAWFLATVMPNLGIYLLYRTAPLIAQFETVQRLVSLTSAASAVIALLFAWGTKNLKDSVWWLFAYQGSITVFAAVHRLDALVWGSILVACLLRFIFFGNWTPRFRLANTERLASIAGGVILGGYSLITIWAIQQQGERKLDFWVAEASLALLVLWLVNQWEKAPKQEKQGLMESPIHRHKWQRWGIPVVALLLFAIMPLLFTPLHANELIAGSSSFTKLSLISFPIISPAFWGLLLSVWVIKKLRWLEKIAIFSLTNRYAWRAGAQLSPKKIYNATEIFLFKEGVDQAAQTVSKISRQLYEILERTTFETGSQYLVKGALSFSTLLYRILERTTFEAGLQYLVKGALSFSTLLRRMHTGRLRVNLLWVAVTMVAVLVMMLARTGG